MITNPLNLYSSTGTPATMLSIYNNTGTSTATSSNTIGPVVWVTSSGGTTPVLQPSSGVPYVPDHIDLGNNNHVQTITFRDGSMIHIDRNGNYRIEDANAKVTYKANRVRDFNSFINASDKLEDFIRYCGQHGVRQGGMLELPIKHFVGWLIVQAALADDEVPPEVHLLEDLRPVHLLENMRPRCVCCGRFMRKSRATVCRVQCLEKEL